MEEAVEKAKELIRECESNLADAKKDLDVLLYGIRCMKEMRFKEKYGVSAEIVRDEYHSRVLALSGSCGHAHTTKIIDMNVSPNERKDFIEPGASHIFLLPKHYIEALQTEKESEAYAIINQKIWIDPETHIERWGN